MAVFSMRKILIRSVPVLSLLVLLEMVGGSFLGTHYHDIRPIFLVLLPPFLALGGNVGSVFGSRISSALHLGTIRPSLKSNGVLRSNVLALLSSGLISFSFLGLFVHILSTFTSVPSLGLVRFLSITLLSGTCLTLFTIGLSLYTCFASFKRGIDPDDYVVPIVTTTTDLVGILFLLTFIALLGT